MHYYYEASRGLWDNYNFEYNPKAKILSIVNSDYTLIPKESKKNQSNILAKIKNIKGINAGALKIVANGTKLLLPANKTFKITGTITVKGNSSGPRDSSQGQAAFIRSKFLNNCDGTDCTVFISSDGYVESSTESYDDGGVTNPLTIIQTGSQDREISLKLWKPVNGDTYMAGEIGDQIPGSYLIVEEL